MSVRECIDGPQFMGSRDGYHDWQLLDPSEPPPRTLVCTRCGKHVPPWPSDPDYKEHAESAPADPAGGEPGRRGR